MNTKKFISCVVVPLAITGLLAYSVNEYCVRKTEELYPTSGVWHLYNNDVKDKGIALLNLSVKNGHMMMFGTSELNNSPDIKVTTVPTKFYPNQYLNREVDIVGRPGAETLINTIRIASIDGIQKVPVVFISSFTWFRGKEYYKEGIQNTFSELQYFRFLNNNKISTKVKNQVSQNVYYYLKNSSMFHEAMLLSWLYSDENKTKKVIRLALSPYFKARYVFMILKDNVQAFKLVRKYAFSYNKNKINIDWEKDKGKSIINAKEISDSSRKKFYTYSSFSTKLTDSKLNKLKGQMKNDKMNISNEYEFHDLFCSVANELGSKPYIVLASINGYYFDHLGLTIKRRNSYYTKMAEINKKHAIPYLDLQYIEYVPYLYRDSAHFSSGGWFEINEKITKHFEK